MTPQTNVLLFTKDNSMDYAGQFLPLLQPADNRVNLLVGLRAPVFVTVFLKSSSDFTA